MERRRIRGLDKESEHESLNQLVVKSVRMIQALLEANQEEKVISQIIRCINFDFLIAHMTRGFYKFAFKIKNFQRIFQISNFNRITNAIEKREEISSDLFSEKTNFDPKKLLSILNVSQFDQEISSQFEIYQLLKILSQQNEEIRIKIESLDAFQNFAFQFYQQFTGQVEIVYENEILNFQFIIHPCCFYVEKKQLNSLLRQIKRDTPKDKINDIISFSNDIFLVMEHRCQLFNKLKKFKINLNIYNQVEIFITLIGIVINVLMVLNFRKKIVYGTAVEDEEFGENHWLFRLVGYLLFIFLILRLYLWYVMHYTVEVKKFRNKMIEEMKEEIEQTQIRDEMGFRLPQISTKQEEIKQKDFSNIKNKKKDTLKLMEDYFALKGLEGVPVRTYYWTRKMQYFLDQKIIIVKMLFLNLSILALFFGFTFVYSLFLLDIVHHFTILQNLIFAFTKNSK